MVNVVEPPSVKQLTATDGPPPPAEQCLMRLPLHDNMAMTTSGDYMQVRGTDIPPWRRACTELRHVLCTSRVPRCSGARTGCTTTSSRRCTAG